MYLPVSPYTFTEKCHLKLVEQLLACIGTNFNEKCHLKLVEQLLACIGKKYLKLTDYAG